MGNTRKNMFDEGFDEMQFAEVLGGVSLGERRRNGSADREQTGADRSRRRTRKVNEPKYSAEQLAELGIETIDGYVDSSVLYELEQGRCFRSDDDQKARTSASNQRRTSTLPSERHEPHPERTRSDRPSDDRPRDNRPRNDPPKAASLAYTCGSYGGKRLLACVPCRKAGRPCSKAAKGGKETPADEPCTRCVERQAKDEQKGMSKRLAYNAYAFCQEQPTEAYVDWYESQTAGKAFAMKRSYLK